EDRARIIEILCEEMYAPGELDEAEVVAAIDTALASLARDKASWPAVTDCDRLDQAFAALDALGIIALQNAGYTQSGGYDDVRQHHDEHADRNRVIGYCFYHGQDLERAVHGEGLYLAFGPIDARNEATEGSRIGALIVEELKRAGFTVQWDGTFGKRIHIRAIDWKRR